MDACVRPVMDRYGLRRWCWLLGAVLALLAPLAQALDGQVELRDLRMAHWGVDDGLPQIAVLALAQDHDGYLWIGTQNGIARFDGTRFTVHDRNSSGIDTTLATTVLVDSRNRIWFGTPRGVICIEKNRLRTLSRAGSAIGVNAIAEHADGRVVFATDSGLYQPEGDLLSPIPQHSSAAHSLLADAGQLWVGGSGHLRNAANPSNASITLPDGVSQVDVISRHGDALWLGTDHGVLRMDLATKVVSAVDPALSGFAVSALLWDRDDNLWVGSNGTLLRYRPDGRVDRTDGKEVGVQLWIHSIIEGREGQLWIGTHRDSLLRLSDNPGSLVGTRDGLSDAFVWSLLKDADGRLLIGTNSGLERRDHDGRVRRVIESRDLPDPSIYTLADGDDGAVWLGTRHGLALWRNGSVEVAAALDPLRSIQINALLRNARDDYWIATTNGLYRYRGGVLEHLEAESGSSVARVRALLPLGPDDLMIGTEDGLRRVRAGRIERLAWASSLDQSFVTRLNWIGPDLLAIGTMDRGLGLVRLPRDVDGQFDTKSLDGAATLRLIDVDHGLSSRNIWTLDRIDDYLYIGSIQGVYRVAVHELPDPDSTGPAPAIEMQYVYAAPGRNARSLQRLACCNGGGDARSLRDGDAIWYASTDGAVRVDSRTVRARPAPPQPHVEAIRNDNETHAPDTPIALDGQRRDPAIEYTGLSLIDSETIQFRYQLLGYDRDWQAAQNRRVAYYTHLPPGDYRFVVQARHPTGSWSADSTPLLLSVIPHWYERRALQTIAALAVVGLLAGFIAQHGRRARRREERLERAVAERTAALQRAVSHLREANVALAEESRTDVLTGLSNRRLDLGRGLDRGTLALLDIDHFKDINDQHGHASGDLVLIELAGLLKAFVGSGDQVVRWGGEEFLMFLSGRPMADALAFGEALRRRIASHAFHLADGQTVALTCSIGFAEHSIDSQPGADWQSALELADAALYEAKRTGRNRSVGVRPVRSHESERTAPNNAATLTASADLQWIHVDEMPVTTSPVVTWPGMR